MSMYKNLYGIPRPYVIYKYERDKNFRHWINLNKSLYIQMFHLEYGMHFISNVQLQIGRRTNASSLHSNLISLKGSVVVGIVW